MLFTLFKFVVAVFIIRFHCELSGLAFNPIYRKIRELTEPVVLPVRNVLRKMKVKTSFDPSSATTGLIISLIAGILLVRDFGLALIAGFLVIFLGTWLNVFVYSILLGVIASWLQAPQKTPAMQIVYAIEGIIIAPLRKFIPPIGMFDFTPMVALMILFALQSALQSMLRVIGA